MHYLDDFLVAGAHKSNDCFQLMTSYSDMCEEIGVPLAPEKTIGPTSYLTFLGLDIDTNAMLVKIPAEKLDKLRFALLDMLNRKKITLKELQSLTGLLSFCSRAIPAARAFNRRFYDAMSRIKKHFHRIRITVEMKEDAMIWLRFLENFNGCSFYDKSDWIDANNLQLYTDSAGRANLGCAAIFQTHWIFLPWPINWSSKHLLNDITFLELVPIVLAFYVWEESLKNRRLILNTDNMALVSVLNTKTSKSKRVMHLLRPLILLSMRSDIQFKAVHIEGKRNIVADAISRRQWSRFRQNFPNADGSPLQVPNTFLNLLFSLEQLKY